MMRSVIMMGAASVALTGCATTSEPAVRTVEVEVPVPVPCLTQEQLAKLPEPESIGDRLGRTPETAEQDRDILAASSLRLRAWGRSLYAPLKACAE